MFSPVLYMELLVLKMMKRITLTKIMGLQILFTRTMQKKQQQILILCFMQMMLYIKMKSQNFLEELIDLYQKSIGIYYQIKYYALSVSLTHMAKYSLLIKFCIAKTITSTSQGPQNVKNKYHRIQDTILNLRRMKWYQNHRSTGNPNPDINLKLLP